MGNVVFVGGGIDVQQTLEHRTHAQSSDETLLRPKGRPDASAFVFAP